MIKETWNPITGNIELPMYWHIDREIDIHEDIFDPEIPYNFIDLIFAKIMICSNHHFNIFTSHSKRSDEYFTWEDHYQYTDGCYEIETRLEYSLRIVRTILHDDRFEIPKPFNNFTINENHP